MKTAQEFNAKYKEYLALGHYGLDINDEEVIQWLDMMFENYLIKIEGFVYYQIKIKFGNTVRFYSSLGTDGDIKGAALADLIESNVKTMQSLKGLQDNLYDISKLVSDKLQELK